MNYLTFSDAAKVADIARNLFQGNGFVSRFTFYYPGLVNNKVEGFFSSANIPKLHPYILSLFFRVFGINDGVVIGGSMLFFILTVVLGGLLAKKLFGKTTAFVYLIALLFSQQLIAYAMNGATEIIFTFEILLVTYLYTFKGRLAQLLFLIGLLIMYLTRPQAVIIIIPFILLFLLRKFSLKQTLIICLSSLVLIFSIDAIFVRRITGRSLFYPIFVRGLQAARYYYPGGPSSDSLRGGNTLALSNSEVLKKTFYNLYNFYKLLPNIMSSTLFSFYVLSLFIWDKRKNILVLKLITLLIAVIVFVTTAMTIPLFRYLHPIIPLIYLFASEMIVILFSKILEKSKNLIVIKLAGRKILFSKRMMIGVCPLLFMGVMYIPYTLGSRLLDTRYEANRTNRNKPPIYVNLALELKSHTTENDIIVTNLDTWGSWYGERKTVWYPLDPDMLMPQEGGDITFDYIYLTNYLLDDENYRMTEEWKQIFDHPDHPENKFIRENFKLVGIYKIPAPENYEAIDGEAILLKRKIPAIDL